MKYYFHSILLQFSIYIIDQHVLFIIFVETNRMITGVDLLMNIEKWGLIIVRTFLCMCAFMLHRTNHACNLN